MAANNLYLKESGIGVAIVSDATNDVGIGQFGVVFPSELTTKARIL
jgi:hypothetical protein